MQRADAGPAAPAKNPGKFRSETGPANKRHGPPRNKPPCGKFLPLKNIGPGTTRTADSGTVRKAAKNRLSKSRHDRPE